MISNALLASTGITLALLFLLLGQLRFLIPYRSLLIHHDGTTILLCIDVLLLNLTAALFTFERRFFLKDTGRKLAHFDRELNAGRTPMPPYLHREELQ